MPAAPTRLDEGPRIPAALNVATGLLVGRALFLLGRWLWPKACIAIDNNFAQFD